MDEIEIEVRKIRESYPWLEEATIYRYAEQCVKNRRANELEKDI